MSKRPDPTSKAASFRALSAETGIPVNVLLMRHYSEIPLDAPYTPRPKGADRELVSSVLRAARDRGKTRYEGGACSRCGGTTRYTKSCQCVACEAQNRKKRLHV